MKGQNYWGKLKPSKSIFRRKFLSVVLNNASSKNMGKKKHIKNLKFCLRKLCFPNYSYPSNTSLVLYKRVTWKLCQLNFQRHFDIIPKEKFFKKISNCGTYRNGGFLGGWWTNWIKEKTKITNASWVFTLVRCNKYCPLSLMLLNTFTNYLRM